MDKKQNANHSGRRGRAGRVSRRGHSARRPRRGRPPEPPQAVLQPVAPSAAPQAAPSPEGGDPMRQRLLEGLRACKGRPVGSRQLAGRLHIRKSELLLYENAIEALKQEGLLFEQRHQLVLCESVGMFTGRIVKISDRFAFAAVEGAEQDIFIPGRCLMGAVPGDVVLIRPKRQYGERPEGEVVQILTRADYQFTGVVRLEGERAVVVPDGDGRISYEIMRSASALAREGDKVLAKIFSRGARQSAHKVRVVQVFGSADRAEVCARAVLAAKGVPVAFPDPVQAEAAKAAALGLPPQEVAKRLDLRGKTIFTIDGADTKDIDDAISLERLPDGWALGVHIADVSYYVRPGSALDDEAYNRGTSVYYANQVIPMLPKELSNGVCSLNPQEDRLAFSALMELDEQGELRRFRFEKTVIRSRIKGVYSEINALFAGEADADIRARYAPVLEPLALMRQLAALRKARRRSRGAIDLQSAESKILIGEDGRAEDIRPRVQGESEEMIEEFMLAANEAAATFGIQNELPFLFRIHEKPAAAKLEALHEVLASLGVPCQAVRLGVTQAELSQILEGVRGTPLWRIVNGQILRAMTKARYSEQNLGHYGLVTENYSHFTSPIRRYPDLAIHRIMSARLSGMRRENIEKNFRAFAKAAADRSSECELRAVQAERDCEDCYKAEYILTHLGESFEGVISSVAPHGIYVELPNTVEGLIRMAALPEGEYENDGSVSVTERLSGKRYRVGDPIAVTVAGANVSAGQVDFVLAQQR